MNNIRTKIAAWCLKASIYAPLAWDTDHSFVATPIGTVVVRKDTITFITIRKYIREVKGKTFDRGYAYAMQRQERIQQSLKLQEEAAINAIIDQENNAHTEDTTTT